VRLPYPIERWFRPFKRSFADHDSGSSSEQTPPLFLPNRFLALRKDIRHAGATFRTDKSQLLRRDGPSHQTRCPHAAAGRKRSRSSLLLEPLLSCDEPGSTPSDDADADELETHVGVTWLPNDDRFAAGRR
jgi:hypothetical protein